ncbi:MAG TPA: hypothetical protein VGO89_10635 [Streptomyces sp.]|jgi:hypothetical protein|nr:hypothetical protein [Streptomyces sp.]
MRTTLLSLAAVTLILAGCQNKLPATASDSGTATSATSTPAPSSSASLSPEQLGTLGAQIKKQPNDADALLAQHGLTAQSFAAAIRKVSENPADSKRYTTAYRTASQ